MYLPFYAGSKKLHEITCIYRHISVKIFTDVPFETQKWNLYASITNIK